MSQAGVLNRGVYPPFSVTETITGNSGGPVGPNFFNNIDLLGGNNINIVGDPATFTLTVNVTGTTNHDVQVGNATGSLTSITNGTTGQLLTAVSGANPSWQTYVPDISITGDSGGAQISNAFTFTGGTTGLTFAGSANTFTLTGILVVANGGTGADTLTGVLTGNGTSAFTASAVTQHDVLVGGASNAIVSITNGTTGQIFTANTGANPSWENVPASSISITGDTGGALTGNSFTFTASGIGLSFGGSGTTETLSGTLKLANGGTNANLTASNGGIFYSTASAGAILAGTATADQVLLSGSSTTPAWSTATYPATTTINQLLYSSANNTIGGVTAGDYGVLISSSSGVPSWLANGTTGQILTATTSGTPSWENAAASGITTIDGDSGSVTGSTVTISGGTTGLTTSGSGTTMDLTGTLIVGNGGTGVATMTTAYAPVCAGTTATGNLQVASTGLSTSGYVLTSNGASALPSFKAPSTGALVQVGTTQTANNSASISFTSAISASYNTYLLNFSNVYPASNNEPLQMVISTNNGSSYITSSYQAGLVNWSYNQSPGLGGNANSTSAVLLNNGMTNSQSDAASGQLWLSNTGNGGSFYCWGNATGTAGGTALIIQIAGTNNVTGVNAIQLAMGSGNITAGTFSLYGLVGS